MLYQCWRRQSLEDLHICRCKPTIHYCCVVDCFQSSRLAGNGNYGIVFKRFGFAISAAVGKGGICGEAGVLQRISNRNLSRLWGKWSERLQGSFVFYLLVINKLCNWWFGNSYLQRFTKSCSQQIQYKHTRKSQRSTPWQPTLPIIIILLFCIYYLQKVARSYCSQRWNFRCHRHRQWDRCRLHQNRELYNPLLIESHSLDHLPPILISSHFQLKVANDYPQHTGLRWEDRILSSSLGFTST